MKFYLLSQYHSNSYHMTSIVGLAAAPSFSTTFLFSAYVGYKAAHEQPGDATFDILMVSPLIGVPSGLLVAAGGILYTIAKSHLTFSSFGWGLMVGVASVPCCIASTYAGIFAGAFLGNSMG